jgi:acyl-CoA reductase-like NAD-dependent aldehyde dehydrogenase
LGLVQDQVKDALKRGARLVTGGDAVGQVHAPTILTQVPGDAPICREETFGPVVVVESVDTAEEAMSKALDTRYGLSASIMTEDHERGLEMAQRFNCGIVHINGPTMASEPSLPNGGVKDSGWGRSGHYAIEDFTEIRLMTMTRGRGRYPV